MVSDSKDIFSGSSGTFSSSNYPGCLVVNSTMTDDNIHYAAYQWVTNNKGAFAAYGDIRSWDTSRVTKMANVFGVYNPFAGNDPDNWTRNWWNKYFSADLSQWNTSNVVDMSGLFMLASSFNCDLSLWKTKHVTNMQGTFAHAVSFNGNLSKWDTSHVTSMSSMFWYATSFNGDLSTWDTSHVTTMFQMFWSTSSFNQVLCWDMSTVLDSRDLFTGSGITFSSTPYPSCLLVNNTMIDGNIHYAAYQWVTNNKGALAAYGDIRFWDTSRVTKLTNVFGVYNPFAGNDPDNWTRNWWNRYFSADLSQWNTSAVVDLYGLFMGALSFNGDVSQWSTKHVSNMQGTFAYAVSFNGNLSEWDTSHVTSMSSMFWYATSFNGDLSTWDTSHVTNMYQMFWSASSFNQVLCWDISKVADAHDMFTASGGSLFLTSYPSCVVVNNIMTDDNIHFAAYKWVTSNKATLATYGDIQFWDTSRVTKLTNVFGVYNPFAGNNPNDWTKNWWNRYFTIDLLQWNTSQVVDMAGLFMGASSFNGDLSHWDTSHVTNMQGTFWHAVSFNNNLSGWNTIHVSNMYQMFWYASSFNRDLSRWDTSHVTSMSQMFWYASSFNGNLLNWNTSRVTNLYQMFGMALSFNQILCWDISKVSNLQDVFSGSAFSASPYPSCLVVNNTMTDHNIHFAAFQWVTNNKGALAAFGDIRFWDTSRVTKMANVFGVYNPFSGNDPNNWNKDWWNRYFSADLSLWNTSQVVDMAGLFMGASSFNGDLSLWETNYVMNMQGTFWHALSFNGDISEWDTSRVTNMYQMFWYATSFNGDLSNWDTSHVTNTKEMFWSASFFNQVLCWDTSKVANLHDMFTGSDGALSVASFPSCLVVNNTMTDYNIQYAAYKWVTNNKGALAAYGDIQFWDTSRVTNIANVFGVYNPFAGNDPNNWKKNWWNRLFSADLSQWNTSQVVDMSGLFMGASSFNANLSRWKTNHVTNMQGAFWHALSFNGDQSQWDTSHVTNMYQMFWYALSFNGDLSQWDTGNVTNMYQMFWSASSFHQVLCWDISKSVKSTQDMFTGSSGAFSHSPFPSCSSAMPTASPTSQPSGPTAQPSTVSSARPSASLTSEPSDQPVDAQTPTPTRSKPSNEPSISNRPVSHAPSVQPTLKPSNISPCIDSNGVFAWPGGSSANCRWVLDNLSRDTCSVAAARTNCPATCGLCPSITQSPSTSQSRKPTYLKMSMSMNTKAPGTNRRLLRA